MSETVFRFFVGIDWATVQHEVCLMDSSGTVLERRQVEHSGDAIGKMLEWLACVSDDDPSCIAVGIEVPRGPLVESLIERGFAVYSINPKQLDRFRDRRAMAGCKDDALDALVLADSLRSDRHCYRRVRLDDPVIIRIREHRDVPILLSLPGVGRVILATMLAEASQPLAERDYHALRAYSGVAPITRGSGKRSGKRAQVLMRRSCCQRLRNVLYHRARVATQHDDPSREHFAALRSRGHTHGRALRGVADRLLKVAMAMLRDQTEYDPARRHQGKPLMNGAMVDQTCSLQQA